jgi:hypothetical protein
MGSTSCTSATPIICRLVACLVTPPDLTLAALLAVSTCDTTKVPPELFTTNGLALGGIGAGGVSAGDAEGGVGVGGADASTGGTDDVGAGGTNDVGIGGTDDAGAGCTSDAGA